MITNGRNIWLQTVEIYDVSNKSVRGNIVVKYRLLLYTSLRHWDSSLCSVQRGLGKKGSNVNQIGERLVQELYPKMVFGKKYTGSKSSDLRTHCGVCNFTIV